ncbi:MAG: dTMP kinase [Candidatus Paceibacterota bacterium]|jgi:dTMP kinase
MKGKHIIVDGLDGCGKGTQMGLLREKFGSSVVFTREPGGTPLAEEIRKILLDNQLAGRSTALNNFLLFWAAREDLLQQLIVPSLREGKCVFSDRGDSSTFAFQLCGEEHEELLGAFLFMRKLVFESPGRRSPDLYVILDLPAEEAYRRMSRDTERTKNHFDDRELEYHKRVRGGFRRFASYAPVEFVDATRSPEEIHRSVLAVLAKKITLL